MRLSYVCPYCFEKHRINEMEFRCQNTGLCGKVPDTVKQAYTGGGAVMDGKCFPAPKKTVGAPKEANCPDCNGRSRLRVCPSCHNKLPLTIENDQELIISLIGTRDSGKSSYVGVLIKELQNRIAGAFGHATCNFLSTEDGGEYEARFGSYLYPPDNKPHRLPQTQTRLRGNTIIGANRPILCTFKFRGAGPFGGIKQCTLVFFDAAGEDFEDEDVLRAVAPYIAHSAGIIFLLDPMANQKVRSALPNDVVRGASNIEKNSVSLPQDVIVRVINLIRGEQGLRETQRIKMPVAAAFSKLDTFERMLDADAMLRKASPHTMKGRFDEKDAFLVGEEMKALLQLWSEQPFVDNLYLHFTKPALFAFSAFGNNPKPDGSLDPPIPHRIEDALLWIMNELKII